MQISIFYSLSFPTNQTQGKYNLCIINKAYLKNPTKQKAPSSQHEYVQHYKNLYIKNHKPDEQSEPHHRQQRP